MCDDPNNFWMVRNVFACSVTSAPNFITGRDSFRVTGVRDPQCSHSRCLMSGSEHRSGNEIFSYVCFSLNPSLAGTSKCLHWHMIWLITSMIGCAEYLSPPRHWPVRLYWTAGWQEFLEYVLLENHVQLIPRTTSIILNHVWGDISYTVRHT